MKLSAAAATAASSKAATKLCHRATLAFHALKILRDEGLLNVFPSFFPPTLVLILILTFYILKVTVDF